jgi:DNA modification methylase
MKDLLILEGDCREVLKSLNDSSVNCIITSPPYYGLRDYGTDNQIGLEDHPSKYIESLLSVFFECHRVLANDGTLWLNIGDSYSGGGRGGNPSRHKSPPKMAKSFSPHRGQRKDRNQSMYKFDRSHLSFEGLKQKELIGIPWRLALALQQAGWYLRQDIIWHKLNHMPESVTDRCTKAHEYIFLLTKSPRYYFDYESILEEYKKPLERWGGDTVKQSGMESWDAATGQKIQRNGRKCRPNEKGKRKRSVWSVTLDPCSEAHFAVFPPKLIEPCVLAGCPHGGVILDPFAGSGTTGFVAMNKGRKAILIESNPEYIKIIEKRTSNITSTLL